MKRIVRDVMTKQVVVIRDTAPFKEIVRLMDEYRVSAMPVVNEAERLVGIVSEADLLLKEGGPDAHVRLFETHRHRAERAKAEGLVARDLMSRPVVTVGPAASVGEAARVMHERSVKRLPVTDGEGKILGIVSRRDLLKVFLRSDEEIRRDVEADVLRGMLWIGPDTITVGVKGGVVTLEGRLEQRSTVDILVGLVAGLDGVVGVDSRVTYEIDDVTHPPRVPTSWSPYTPGYRPYE